MTSGNPYYSPFHEILTHRFPFRTGDNVTPLELAIEANLAPVVETLCRKGADLSASSNPEDSPLWKALQNEDEEIASILVR